MTNKQKLELTWIGKNNPEYEIANIEPRILEERTEFSYGDPNSENMIIHGDNLLTLKALLPEYEEKIKCIYIDPPFNTGQAFEYYDDGLEHSTWLSMMSQRVALLHKLLSPDGTLFVHLDQEENHYMKIILDELFSRSNFLGQIAYERSGVSGIGQGGSFLVNTHEYIMAYAKDKSKFSVVENRGSIPLELKDMKRYCKIFRSPGERIEVARFIAPSTGEPVVIYEHKNFVIETISLRKFEDREEEVNAQYVENFTSIFRNTSVQEENEFQTRILESCGDGLYSADYLVSRGKKKGQQITAYYLNKQVFAWLSDTAEIRNGEIVKINKLSDFWTHADLPKADLANEGGVDFRRGKKPESLLQRIIGLVSNQNDWVLDSFAGSGATPAVAHKMGRKYIGIEMGDHAYSHVYSRLKSVVDGEDQGGISKAVAWKGGGGFKFYELAPSFISIDEFGNPVIDTYYNDTKLIRAMCKLTNYTFAPSQSDYWKQGKGQGSNFIYITTQMLSVAMVQQIVSHLSPNETLLICPKKYEPGCKEVDPRITIKKIPQSILKACQFGKKEYLLPIKEGSIEEFDEEDLSETQE